MLHNFCKDRNIPLPGEDFDDDEDEEAEDNNLQFPAGPAQAGLPFRDNFANLHFK